MVYVKLLKVKMQRLIDILFFSFGLRVSESIDLINGLIQLEPRASRPFQPIVDLG